jgi:protein-tyrosine kinase
MSRIHEALKKAAEERAAAAHAGSTTTDTTEFLEIREDAHRPAEPKEMPPIKPLSGGVLAPKSQAVLRFEDLRERCCHPVWKPNPRMNVFKAQDSEQGGAECFRTLRSRLHQVAATRPLKRILVTSSLPKEGKTFVTTNLALSVVQQADRRVLLIDADLRASRLHLPFGAPCTPGLTEYLRGEADEFSVIQSGTVENLCLIPGGSEVANPSELLLDERMKHLLEVVTPLFDFVILDSAPAIPVHDPNLLADMCDGTLFVLRAGVTDVEIAARAAAQFENKNLLGVVLNGVGPDANYGQYYNGVYGAAEK